ncbi:hypothetical protein RvY_04740 [Ramazzottius varieornatus]|uniref:Uncharacterized protein n=1 Tax=Ramazzottius varieornatus TaxID=947166 RepID=A0A1D1UTA8_RAMVA|nr:hypothetical protein RvY_04740 [Ramazzottius varieornatus]
MRFVRASDSCLCLPSSAAVRVHPQLLHTAYAFSCFPDCKMSSVRKFCGFLAVIACLIGYAAGLSCYECSSLNKQTCSAPAKEALKDCGAGTTICYKYYSKVSNVESVSRGCGKYSGPGGSGIAENQCQETVVQGVSSTVCNCNTDSCNTAGKTANLSVWFFIASLAVSALLAGK